MIQQFTEAIVKTLREAQQSKINVLVAGRCADWADYQKLCGEVRGLALAESELTALAKDAAAYDNDD